METIIKGIGLLLFMFLVFPLWAYVMAKLISLGWHNGRIASLLRFSPEVKTTKERNESHAEAQEESRTYN
jgi:hypothetical protein